MEGYYWDPLKKRYDYGANEKAMPTIEETMAARGETPVQDLSQKEIPSKETSKDAMKALTTGLSSEGNMGEKAGQGLMQYGAATANPWLIGAGLVTGAIGGNVAAKRKAIMDAYKDRMTKLENMSTIGRSIG